MYFVPSSNLHPIPELCSNPITWITLQCMAKYATYYAEVFVNGTLAFDDKNNSVYSSTLRMLVAF